MKLKQKLARAMALHKDGDAAQAEILYRKVLAVDGRNVDVLRLLGMAVHQQGRLGEAAEIYDRALSIRPSTPLLLNGLGDIHALSGAIDKAIDCYEKSLAIEAGAVRVRHNLAELYQRKKNYSRAAGLYRQVLAVEPEFVEPHYNLAGVLVELGDESAAMRHYRRALSLNPRLFRAWHNLASLLVKNSQGREALACSLEAIRIEPGYAPAHYNAGLACEVLKQREEACRHFGNAHSLEPANSEFSLSLYFSRRMLCRWEGQDSLAQAIIESFTPEGDQRSGSPYKFLTVTDDPPLNLSLARAYANRIRAKTAPGEAGFVHAKRNPDRCLKIAYLSGNFYHHPTLQLISGVFRRHDYERFDFFYFANCPCDGSELQRELMQNPGEFIDCHGMSDVEVAQRIHRLGIDVLIDLNGYSQYARSGVFALRPAPVQLTYLAYPATTGAAFFDHVLTDRISLPPSLAEFYVEKPLYLTGAYHCYDNEQAISETGPDRSDFGLPAEAFVFCSFNQAYKLDARRFAIWMNILKRCEGSVLWLYADHEEVITNLRAEAGRLGVKPERLVFATLLNKPEHLRRLQLADLMLDTDLYNAHTTAMDALWAGLPVITRIGNNVASRASAAQLITIGLEDLVTEHDWEYEDLAVRLAHDGQWYSEVKSRLIANRDSSPLFDTEARARELEAIYTRLAMEADSTNRSRV